MKDFVQNFLLTLSVLTFFLFATQDLTAADKPLAVCIDNACGFIQVQGTGPKAPIIPPPTAAGCLAAGPAGSCTPIAPATVCPCSANPMWGVPTNAGTSWLYCMCLGS